MNGQRLTALDVLRGIAALIVTFHHMLVFYGEAIRTKLPSNLFSVCSSVSDLNHDAVLFFFVLSGYCIALSLRGKSLTSKALVFEYLQRRFWRLMPGYLIALAFTGFCVFQMRSDAPQDLSLRELGGNLLFLQTSPNVGTYWVAPFGGNGPLWSLSYEVFFYALLPVLYWINLGFLQRWSMPIKFSTTVLVAILCVGANRIFFTPWFAFMSSFPIWLCGWLALVRHPLESRTPFFLVLGVIGLLGITFESRLHSASISSLCHGFAIAFAFYFFLKSNRLNTIVGSLTPLVYIGHGSYFLYILHYPLLRLLRSYDFSLATAFLAVLLLIILCALVEPWLTNATRRLLRNSPTAKS